MNWCWATQEGQALGRSRKVILGFPSEMFSDSFCGGDGDKYNGGNVCADSDRFQLLEKTTGAGEYKRLRPIPNTNTKKNTKMVIFNTNIQFLF